MSENQPNTRRGADGRLWVEVATASGEAEAAILRGVLDGEGIPVWEYRESAGRAIGLGVGPLGTTTLYVPEELYEDAVALLDLGETEDAIWDEEDEALWADQMEFEDDLNGEDDLDWDEADEEDDELYGDDEDDDPDDDEEDY